MGAAAVFETAAETPPTERAHVSSLFLILAHGNPSGLSKLDDEAILGIVEMS
jgi:hypothetical protein